MQERGPVGQTIFGDGTRRLDYSRIYKSRVVERNDPLKEGRVGVFVPNLLTDPPADTAAPQPQRTQLTPSSIFTNAAELTVATGVNTDVYFWARPSAFMVEDGAGGAQASGSFYVPKLGTIVEVYFEGNDPNKPYWRLATPTIAGQVTAGTNIGMGTNLANGAANWTGAATRPDVHVVTETDAGHIVYLDKNPNNNAFVVRWANGHTLSIADASESGIILETGKGHTVQLDENSKQIRIRTQTGKCSAVLDDGAGTVSVQAENGMTCGAPTMVFNAGTSFTVNTGEYRVNAGSLAQVNAAGGTWTMDGENTMVPWYANDPNNF
jgi:hypothetical protein